MNKKGKVHSLILKPICKTATYLNIMPNQKSSGFWYRESVTHSKDAIKNENKKYFTIEIQKNEVLAILKPNMLC